ncbi:MAG: hypothetical protein KDC56_01580 [Flavobacteriaceae bacterium]|nr:hypothetical protein [Flavobacteriaceae bacterium]
MVNKELIEALEMFVGLEQLISYPKDTPDEFKGEGIAVAEVIRKGKEALKKAKEENTSKLSAEKDGFIVACKDVRKMFADIVYKYPISHNLELRTNTDTLLIMYDNLIELRLTYSNMKRAEFSTELKLKHKLKSKKRWQNLMN